VNKKRERKLTDDFIIRVCRFPKHRYRVLDWVQQAREERGNEVGGVKSRMTKPRGGESPRRKGSLIVLIGYVLPALWPDVEIDSR
jgi:hypothetical protein